MWGSFRSVIILLFCCFAVESGMAQLTGIRELERLKKTIRQSTLYDSVAVFSNGRRAIALSKQLKKPLEEGIIYQYYGNFYYYSNRVEKANEYYRKAISVAKANKDIQLQNSTEIRQAFILSETDMLKGETAFIRLLKEAEQHDLVDNSIEAYNGLGILYENRMMRDKAVEYYLKGLRIAEQHHKKYFISFLLNNLGLLKFNNKQYAEAKADLERGLKLALQTEEWRLVGNLQNNLGLVTREMEDYPSAIKHYQATVRMTKKLGFPFGIGAAYINLANSYQLNKQYREGMQFADSAIAIFRNNHASNYLGIAYLLKGSLHADLGNLGAAKNYADSVSLTLNKQFDIENHIDLFELKAKIAEKSGDFKRAFELKSKYYEWSDSIEEITNQDKLADLQVLYGKERVENQLSKEKTKNTLLAKEGQLRSANWRMAMLIVMSLFLGVLAFLYVRYVNKIRKQQATFSRRLIENVDDERTRISKDLHDDIGQLLSVIKSKVNMYQTGRLPSMDGLETEIGEIIEHTRGISHQLHPSGLEKIGLERSLASILEKTQEGTGLICSLEIECTTKSWPIEIQTQLYRIFQECINNTIKHAGAKALKISIEMRDGVVWAKYRDNGKGIAPENWRKGLGWLTIKERVRTLDGKMEVSSTPNQGMKLRIKFKAP